MSRRRKSILGNRKHTAADARRPLSKSDESQPIGRREHLVDSLKLPKDMLLGASILTMTGSHELWVENYKGIIEYTHDSIILQAKTGQISIGGRCLTIDYYTNEDMKIIGNIQCVRFL